MKQVNGSGSNVATIAPPEGRQVYGCGNCDAQGHRLRPIAEGDQDGEMFCGVCYTVSGFRHIERRPADFAKRRLRIKQSLEDGQDNLICGRCGFNRFHLHPTGTITCYRCRHAAANKFANPAIKT